MSFLRETSGTLLFMGAPFWQHLGPRALGGTQISPYDWRYLNTGRGRRQNGTNRTGGTILKYGDQDLIAGPVKLDDLFVLTYGRIH